MKLQRIIGDQPKDGGISLLAVPVLVIGGCLAKEIHRGSPGVKSLAPALDPFSD
jgi:hypothetical protein